MRRVRLPAVTDPAGARPAQPAADPYVAAPVVNLAGMRVLAIGGLGTLATAFALSAARAEANVVLADLVPEDGGKAFERAESVAAAFEAAGCTPPTVYHADVTDPEDAIALLEAAAPVDVVVNFAGLHHPPMDPVLDDAASMAATFERVVRVNLNGAFHVTVAAARVMTPRRSGHIVHLCSNGSRASLYGSYAYNAGKHGVEGVVKTAAAQLAPLGVRVNGVAPGTVITDLNRDLSFDESGTPRPRAKSILAHTPTKRFATADGVAETLLAMCVPQHHFTGNVVFCDDGYNVEGHSWPEGNVALYEGGEAVDRLYRELDARYPRG
ncbi:MAG: SDR family NAD(P)-dependent oxidoreductase [Spirochaetota bacterium]